MRKGCCGVLPIRAASSLQGALCGCLLKCVFNRRLCCLDFFGGIGLSFSASSRYPPRSYSCFRCRSLSFALFVSLLSVRSLARPFVLSPALADLLGDSVAAALLLVGQFVLGCVFAASLHGAQDASGGLMCRPVDSTICRKQKVSLFIFYNNEYN